MIVHIFVYDKFHISYIKKINSLFDNHTFFVYDPHKKKTGAENAIKNACYSSDFKSTKKWIYSLETAIDQAERVIFHSIFSTRILLSAVKKIHDNSQKYFWVIWGGDLYNAYWNRNNSLPMICREFIRRYFIKRIDSVGIVKGDYRFLKKHYKTNATFYLASYTYDLLPYSEKKNQNEMTSILLANCASNTCRYEDIIIRLSRLNTKNYIVYCILSYPNNQEYIEKICKMGRKMLEDRFIPVTEFMDYNDYMRFLEKIDIAVFNHDRQQALGNIASLIYLGKTVFINHDNCCGEFFEDMGAVIFPVEELSEKWISKPCMTKEIRNSNKQCIENFFSDEEFKKRWERIFYKKKENV
ncbi:TDP-N-acetylfucosamine:lipid II N-acetylfucosaminyltransferase [Butyrivibrio sp. FC2001]|uniref:TDP-N-acetylfucosamine:lipid II N-acetylfucosaminyltransferase n=1 Tax=Butyrivibrio sp. FC2001 TaxID=1280671 RepID=UPI0004215D3C|nr:TDP-N-acetylfucosamine:lipid II N-acetylfucosaminyltransferase [Butyrivibrio sp. FC2001]